MYKNKVGQNWVTNMTTILQVILFYFQNYSRFGARAVIYLWLNTVKPEFFFQYYDFEYIIVFYTSLIVLKSSHPENEQGTKYVLSSDLLSRTPSAVRLKMANLLTNKRFEISWESITSAWSSGPFSETLPVPVTVFSHKLFFLWKERALCIYCKWSITKTLLCLL